MQGKFTVPVIGIAGAAASGKSEVAKLLEQKLDSPIVVGYADQIKLGLLAILEDCLPFDVACEAARCVWGSSSERAKQIKDLSRNDGSALTYRHALQSLGDILRKSWHKDIHIQLLLARIDVLTSNGRVGCIIVPDVRYLNEAEAITSRGGHVWRIRRGTLPVWRELANCVPALDKVSDLLRIAPHASEREMYYRAFDRHVEVEIKNNGSLADLETKVMRHLWRLRLLNRKDMVA